ncbi:conserved hypothetical protein [Histoplasma capsulatum var. duboisii H88]|uniref:NYN domain-containing protein n=2 Tax=Ajellomyces capsulatus TaxID=5037 RepID=F0U7U0_AJEC8|nr:conserved hypothetical protein [Histoplasma capsulatum H143]EGC42452.1 conserved hypothetical protein [Histoplasma capsulatum var. duboisii H88]QSS51138.1 hypothetical protein I7I53_06379 [Histoplasma capsulatum var. duboisii H88]
MSTSGTSSTWDFTPVINLLHSFSTSNQTATTVEHVASVTIPLETDVNTVRDGCQKLGDFGPLWDLLSGGDLPSGYQATDDAPSNSSRLLGQEQYLTNSQNSKELEVLSGSREKTTEKQQKIRVLLEKKMGEGIKHNNRIRPRGFPLSEASDEEDKPRPPIALSILQNPHRPVVNQPTSALAPRIHSQDHRLPTTKSNRRIEPLLQCSPVERRLDLIAILSARFPRERECLLKLQGSPTAHYKPNYHPTGVHVFVDISNISVGFHDCIKMARDVPITVRVPRVPLSFRNFALILERGRSTSKRVLVGSDRFPAIDEAEEIGYEINILERVQKAKDATPRKKKFLRGNGNNRLSGAMGNNTQAQSSGSETTSGPGPERWVEQGVDEILHLKILESLVDSDSPSTIVLATGDAAEAEYSDGFLKMVGRALQKGWAVELVSFSTTTSREYKRKGFRSQWGSQFRVIKLDEYVEHLLDA